MLAAPWNDFRGQPIPPGLYDLRYAVRPLIKAHAGIDGWRDIALLVPAEPARDSPAEEPWDAAARRASGTPHPAVMALVPGGRTTEALGGLLVDYRDLGDLVVGFVVSGRVPEETAF